MRRRGSLIVALIGSWVSAAANAFGLGEIRLDSALNQPFVARIPLVAVDAEALESLRVRLADPLEFERLGIERADYLSQLRFTVQGGAEPQIVITADRPARDPFLTFLLDVRSVKGRILREYTVLLDPPPMAVTLPTPTPRAVAAPSPPAAVPAPMAERDTGLVRMDPIPRQTPAPTAAPVATAPRAAAAGAGRYGPIQPQETLWSIATALKPEAATMDQILLALYTANPEAFDRGRFDGLMKGYTLTVPSEAEILAVSPEVAKARVDRLRRGLAPVPPARPAPAAPRAPAAVPPPGPPRIATPPPTVTPEPTPEPTPTPEPSPEATPLPQPVSEPPSSAMVEPEPPAATETSEPGGVEVDPVPVQDAPRAMADDVGDAGAEWIEETEPAPVQAPRASAQAPPSFTPPASQAGWLEALRLPLLLMLIAILLVAGLWFKRRRDAARAPHPASSPSAAPAASAAAATVASATALADEAEAAFMAAYAKDAPKPAPKAAAVPPPAEAPVLPDFDATQTFEAPSPKPAARVPETTDFDSTAQFSLDTVQIDLQAQDPAGEADIHLAYGLYDEALLTLNNALEKDPTHPDWLIKRAEVLFAAGRGLAFAEAAEAARPHIPEVAWQKLAVMGRQLLPDSPLFAEGSGTLADADLDLAFEDPGAAEPPSEPAPEPAAPEASEPLPELDFSRDHPEPPPSEPVPTGEAAAEAPSPRSANEPLDFQLESGTDDLLGGELPLLDTGEALKLEDVPELDLDLDLDDFVLDAPASTPPQASAEVTAVSTEGLDFQLDTVLDGPSTAPSAPSAPAEAAPPPADPNRLDFTLEELPPPAAPEPSPAAAEFGDATLEFDLSGFDVGAEPEGQSIAGGDEAATKLDLARAYVDMDEREMARVLLDEVIAEGTPTQQAEARALLARLG